MQKLLERQAVTEGKLTALGMQMVSIAHIPLKNRKTQTEIIETNKRLEMLTQHIINMKLIMNKFIVNVNDNTNAIRFLSFI